MILASEGHPLCLWCFYFLQVFFPAQKVRFYRSVLVSIPSGLSKGVEKLCKAFNGPLSLYRYCYSLFCHGILVGGVGCPKFKGPDVDTTGLEEFCFSRVLIRAVFVYGLRSMVSRRSFHKYIRRTSWKPPKRLTSAHHWTRMVFGASMVA